MVVASASRRSYLLVSICALLVGGRSSVAAEPADSLDLDADPSPAEEAPPDLPDDLTELSLEELTSLKIEAVYGASKHEQKVTEAPASITIVTADDINKFGYKNLADLLRGVRGLFVTYDRNYQYLGIRGFNRPGDFNSRVLLLIDGHRVNDNVYGQAKIGNDFLLDVDLIDRVEIIRGPGSALYGSNAFFGVINVLTKRSPAQDGIEVAGLAGSFETYRGRVTFGHKLKNGLEVLLSGTAYDSEGQTLQFDEFGGTPTSDGVARNLDDESYYSLFANLAWGDFNLQAAYVSRDKDIPTASYETLFGDHRAMTRDNQSYIDLKYHKQLEHVEILARGYLDYVYYRGIYPYEIPGGVLINHDTAHGSLAGTELQVSTEIIPRNRLTLGAEYNDHFRQDQANYDVSGRYLDSTRRSADLGLYVQDEVKILESLRLTAGLRWDHYETFGSHLSPRVALIFSPFERTTLKLAYGEAFRAPSAYELYYEDGSLQKPSADLDPETIRTYELVLEQFFLTHFYGSASVYYYDIEDLISLGTDPNDGLNVFRNIDEVQAYGFELELGGKWDNGLRGSLSYALQRAEDEETEQRLTNSPAHILQAHLVVPLHRDVVFAGLEGIFVSKRKTLAGSSTDPYFLLNCTLFSANLLKGLEISASVLNVFDDEYEDPGSTEHVQDAIGQDGRAFYFQLSYRY